MSRSRIQQDNEDANKLYASFMWQGNRLALRITQLADDRWKALVAATGANRNQVMIDAVCAFVASAGGPGEFAEAVAYGEAKLGMKRTMLCEVAIHIAYDRASRPSPSAVS